jgi:hypothetical protein
VQPGPEDGVQIEVDDHQILLERPAAGHHLAFLVHDHAGAVED